MQTFRYSCDCGALAIGSETCKVHVHNGLGDGTFQVSIVDRAEFAKDRESGMFEFRTVCEGDAVTIYDYDCSGAQPLVTLSGRFGIWALRGTGNMVIERWE